MNHVDSLTATLSTHIAQGIAQAGGWVGFDRFMHWALYAPGLGYYANDCLKLGLMPASGSDFVTAPELSPTFGTVVAVQVREALERTGTRQVWEFGAGSGALAAQLLGALGDVVQQYTIVDVSGSLRARQQQALAAYADVVRWVDALPETMEGVVVGNEVLDAMPVKLLVRKRTPDAGQDGESGSGVPGSSLVWYERGVVVQPATADACPPSVPVFAWADVPTDLRPPLEIEGEHDYLTELHWQGEGFVRTLCERLERGALLLIDYGFDERVYYHPQRHMGTVMCHQAHRLDDNPLVAVGMKDVTAHVNFTGVAVAAQDVGWSVVGYTSQGRFLINCGLGDQLSALPLQARAQAAKLIMEHEMGELFKVLLLAREADVWDAVGFSQGDRTGSL